jgi:hypothetical protein
MPTPTPAPAVPVKPKSAMDKIRAFVSPKSTAGLLRDQKKPLDEALKNAGG